MFRIVREVIDVSAWSREIDDRAAGAFVCFEGKVRDHADGRGVASLTYEAYEALAEKEGEKILREAQAKHEVFHAACVHRVGQLQIGEVAVWVGVSSAHRDEAFAACRYIIDEVKLRLPVWKKEFYADGGSGWVVGAMAEPRSG
jgi:molybdopterin synthase catalytic subunit